MPSTRNIIDIISLCQWVSRTAGLPYGRSNGIGVLKRAGDDARKARERRAERAARRPLEAFIYPLLSRRVASRRAASSRVSVKRANTSRDTYRRDFSARDGTQRSTAQTQALAGRTQTATISLRRGGGSFERCALWRVTSAESSRHESPGPRGFFERSA